MTTGAEPAASPGRFVNPSRRAYPMPTAQITRMVLPDHECPFGRRALQLLRDNDFDVEEQQLTTREEVEAFKAEHNLSTTPLITVDGTVVGGCSDLEKFLVANA
jgi:glutaredoxin